MNNSIFRDEEITQVSGMVRDSFARDLATFEAFSPKYNAAYLTELSSKITVAESRTGTQVYFAKLKAITSQLYADVESLRPKITRLEGYLFLAKDDLSISIGDFGISNIRKALGRKDVEGLLDKLRCSFSYLF